MNVTGGGLMVLGGALLTNPVTFAVGLTLLAFGGFLSIFSLFA
jgi:hypothetical protein